MTNARDIMSGLERVGAAETVEAAAEKMADLHVDALPVCGPEGNVHTMQGMITDRSIIDEVVAERRDPAKTRVGEVAQRDIPLVGVDDPVDEALVAMEEHELGVVPVVEGFRVVGIIDQADVADALPGRSAGTPADR